MKIIITELQRKSLNEMIKLDIKVGDTLMGGKFKNKKVVVKTIGKNDKGDITINGKPLLRFRMLKEEISREQGIGLFKKWLYTMYDEISFLEVSKTYDGYPLIKIYYSTDDNAANYSSWLAMNIIEKWDEMTGGSIPTQPSWYKDIPDNVKFLFTTEELYDDADDEYEDEVINEGVSIPIDKRVELFKKWLYKEYPNISHLEVTRKKDPYLHPSRFKDIPLVIVHYTESDEGEYPTWKPNYHSWLVMNIVEMWNKITGGSIPITGSFYDKIDHKNVKILVDAEEFAEDDEESINESVNPKILDLFDGYIKKIHPEFLVKNTEFRMSSGEDTLYIYTDSTDSYRPGATFFVDLAYNDDVDGKHLLFYDEKHIEEFSNVFGGNWAELFLNWVNKEYEPKLKRYFNDIDWEITGVN